MPGVSVLPGSSTLGSFGPTTTTTATAKDGHYPNSLEEMTVQEIKSKAVDTVQRQVKGASSVALVKQAEKLYEQGKAEERFGRLKPALNEYTKAAQLQQIVLNSNNSKTREVKEVLERFASGDLIKRISTIEEKLKTLEKLQTSKQDEPVNNSGGGSIADRLKALQVNGLSDGMSKRFSRELPTPGRISLTSSMASSSPRMSSASLPSVPKLPPTPSTTTVASSPRSPPITSLVPLIPSTPTSPNPSPHSFVSPSSFGPPSPTSSPPSSPQLEDKFSKAFPSIEELNEEPDIIADLPSVPTGRSTGSSNSSKEPTPFSRSAMLPIERPSSTPITPIVNSFASRPASPTRPSFPTRLGANRPPLPNKNTVFPKELQACLLNYEVLLIDVRSRAEYDRGHIPGPASICIEPWTLMQMQEPYPAEPLERSITEKEAGLLFNNRDKFDLVVIYDGSSQSFGPTNSPLAILQRVIYEKALRKFLKQMPMLLVGGFEAWRMEVDGEEPLSVIGASTSTATTNGGMNGFAAAPTPVASSSMIPMSPSFNVNGMFSSASSAAGTLPEHEIWHPTRSRADTNTVEQSRPPSFSHRPSFSLDQNAIHSREAAYSNGHYSGSPDAGKLTRKPAFSRGPQSSALSQPIPENVASLPMSPRALMNGHAPITYPTFPQPQRVITPHTTGSGAGPSSPYIPSSQYDIASPPVASIHHNLTRRRSDYVDQSQEALGSFSTNRPAIEYPQLSSSSPVLRPPPPAASSALDRQDNRPKTFTPTPPSVPPPSIPVSPRIHSDWPVTYWADVQIGTSGLKNLGNTCYMNAPIQCLSATVPFSRFFREGRWRQAVNYTNPLGTKGVLPDAFAQLVHGMWGGDMPFLTPTSFRRTICGLKSQYNGTDQHDSQEFLSFLLDGIHEDLNRILTKPVFTQTPEQEAALERLPPHIASELEWNQWKQRNDSIIVDYFQGQFRSRLECMTCHKTSTTYNVFSTLQLPIPHSRSGRVPLQRCLDALFNMDVLERDDAWDCPQCKVKRKATKTLSLARLPPILLIHLKRFEANGRFSDKIDTFVDFPMKSLDLTNFMPPPLPPGVDKGPQGPLNPDDPRTQMPPYRYDLYGVTNHVGNLSSGHYTAFIASRGGWLYCDDSSVKSADPKQVVSQRAYVLFYKRIRT